MVAGKIVLITGGNTGIGAAAARLLAEKGANVVINYREDKKSAETLISEIMAKITTAGGGGSAIALQADVTNQEDVAEMIHLIINRYGKIDVVINNASPKPFPRSLQQTELKEFQLFNDVIVRGAYNTTTAVLPQMMAQKKGHIINILTSYVAGMPPAKLSPYVTAKYALEGFSKSLAAELGSSGIRVNMVSPGVTKTKFIDHLPEKLLEIISLQTPLKRIATPEDVANVIYFLVSENADYLTGVNIPVCGGSAAF